MKRVIYISLLIVFVLYSCSKPDLSVKKTIQVTAENVIVDSSKVNLTEDSDNNYVLEYHATLNKKTIILIIAFAVLISALVLAGVRIWKKNKELTDLIDSLEDTRKSNLSSSEAIAELIEDRANLVRSFINYEKDSSPSEKSLPFLDYVEKLQRITEQYRRTIEAFRNDTSYFQKLEKALDAAKDGIMARFRNMFGSSYSEKDYQIISCLFAGMNPTSISFLTGVKAGTIRVKKTRLIDRIEALPESEEKTALLKEIK